MTDPLFFVSAGQLDDASIGTAVALDPVESRHAIKAMRLTPGEKVSVADGHGRTVHGVVDSDSDTAMTVRAERIHDETPPRPAVGLVQALAKGDRDLMGVQTATEVGVDAVTPWESERSIVRLKADKQDRLLDKWSANLLSAAKQSRRSRVPELRQPLRGTMVAKQATDRVLMLVLHEDAEQTLNQALSEADVEDCDEIVMVVGPEGGISPDELRAMEAAGARAVKIGHHVLRSSTAGPIAVALVQQLLSRW